MSELDLLFRYTAMYLIDEVSYSCYTFCVMNILPVTQVLSPIICPLILIFSLNHKSQEIVDFFRDFTGSPLFL